MNSTTRTYPRTSGQAFKGADIGLAQENPLTIDSETGEITPPGDARDGDPMTAELRRVCAAIDAGQDPYPSPAQPTTEPPTP